MAGSAVAPPSAGGAPPPAEYCAAAGVNPPVNASDAADPSRARNSDLFRRVGTRHCGAFGASVEVLRSMLLAPRIGMDIPGWRRSTWTGWLGFLKVLRTQKVLSV